MIRKCICGKPVFSDLYKDVPVLKGPLLYGKVKAENGSFLFDGFLGRNDRVYCFSVGQGINKRHSRFVRKRPFILIDGDRHFGLYFDCDTALKCDFACMDENRMLLSSDDPNCVIYVIDGYTSADVICQYRRMIGDPPAASFADLMKHENSEKIVCMDLLTMLQMLPGLNMDGKLFADLQVFCESYDLMARADAFEVFLPCATVTERFLSVRKKLAPYVYSEYRKALLHGDMLFKPLSFVYPFDPTAAECEDQLIFGDQVMLCPVYKPNAGGRFVYVPEDMKMLRIFPDGWVHEEEISAGTHYISMPRDEVSLFVRRGRSIPLVGYEQESELLLYGYGDIGYELYMADDQPADPKDIRHIRFMVM